MTTLSWEEWTTTPPVLRVKQPDPPLPRVFGNSVLWQCPECRLIVGERHPCRAQGGSDVIVVRSAEGDFHMMGDS